MCPTVTVTLAQASINLNEPNLLLAGAALGVLILAAAGKRRWTFMYLVSASFGAAGFLLSCWVGIATFTLALSYRIFQRLRAPWQALVTVSVGLAGFAGLVLLLDAAGVTSLRRDKRPKDGGLWADITAAVNNVATSPPLLWACLLGGAAATAVIVWRMRLAAKYPYRGLGQGADPDMMYRGITNPNLVTLPVDDRDPRRTFTAKMREQKLDTQGGVCAYQARVPNHPRWEPFRSGVQWEGDHIIPWAAGGATNLPNLQILCADCNSAKSDAYGDKAMKKVQRRWKAKR